MENEYTSKGNYSNIEMFASQMGITLKERNILLGGKPYI